MAAPNRVEQLRRLGLPTYPATAYLTLLDEGPLTARVLATRSRVPVGKIYHALSQLQSRQLVEIRPGKPKVYAARSLRHYLTPLWQSLERAAIEIEGARSPAGGMPFSFDVLRPLAGHLRDAVVVAPLQGPIVEWNDAARRTFGYRDDEARHLPLDALVTSDFRPHLRAYLRRFEGPRADAHVAFETLALTKHGHEFLARFSILPSPRQPPSPAGVIAVVHPSGPHEPLKPQAPAHAARSGLAVLQEGRLAHVDEGLARLLGYERAEQVPASLPQLARLVAPEGRDEVLRRHRMRVHGVPAREHYESVLVARDGRRIRVEVGLRPAALADPHSVVAFVREIVDG